MPNLSALAPIPLAVAEPLRGIFNAAVPAPAEIDDDDDAGEVALRRLILAAATLADARGICPGCFAEHAELIASIVAADGDPAEELDFLAEFGATKH